MVEDDVDAMEEEEELDMTVVVDDKVLPIPELEELDLVGLGVLEKKPGCTATRPTTIAPTRRAATTTARTTLDTNSISSTGRMAAEILGF